MSLLQNAVFFLQNEMGTGLVIVGLGVFRNMNMLPYPRKGCVNLYGLKTQMRAFILK